jgi:hypothetical protein
MQQLLCMLALCNLRYITIATTRFVRRKASFLTFPELSFILHLRVLSYLRNECFTQITCSHQEMLRMLCMLKIRLNPCHFAKNKAYYIVGRIVMKRFVQQLTDNGTINGMNIAAHLLLTV